MRKTVMLTEALSDPTMPVETMIPVAASSVPRELRASMSTPYGGFRWVSAVNWTEIGCPTFSQGGCRYGCKLYARRQGATLRYAVFHSRVYGHSYPSA